MLIHFPFSLDQKLTIKQKLEEGNTIFYPTETLPALGCILDSKKAVQKIRRIKLRDNNKAMLMLAQNWQMILPWVDSILEKDLQVLKKLKSAPLTIALPSKHLVRKWLNPNGTSLAFRITSNECALEILSLAQRPLVSTSANLAGLGFDFEFALDELVPKVDIAVVFKSYYKKGSANFGLPSTVVQYIPQNRLVLIRQGDYTIQLLKNDLPRNWQLLTNLT